MQVRSKATVIVLLLIGSLLLVACQSGYETAEIETELDGVEVATLSLDPASQDIALAALPADSELLLAGEVDYFADYDYDVFAIANGQAITLSEQGRRLCTDCNDMVWDLELAQGVLWDVDVRLSSGELRTDLAGIMLSGLDLDMASGDAQVTLGGSPEDVPMALNVKMSSGDLALTVPDGARVLIRDLDMASGDGELIIGADVDLDAEILMSSGDLKVTVAPGTALRVNVKQSSSGDVDIALTMEKVEQGERDEEGVWESPGFAEAEHQVILNIEMSSGDVDIVETVAEDVE